MGEIPLAELSSRLLSNGGLTHQQSSKLEILRGETPCSRVGTPSGIGPTTEGDRRLESVLPSLSRGISSARGADFQGTKDDAHTSMQCDILF